MDPDEVEKKSGVLYFPSIPPFFTISRMRHEIGRLAPVKRIFLQPERPLVRTGDKPVKKGRKKFVEGWIEIGDKSLAKRLALSIDNTPVGGKKRSMTADSLWSCKYLPGFKWVHLMEQLQWERRVQKQRMSSEVAQAKRTAAHFAEQVEKGARLKRLEQKVLEKQGVWQKYERQMARQRERVDQKKGAKKARGSGEEEANEQLLSLVFG